MSEQERIVATALAQQLHTVVFEEDWFKGLLLHVQDVSAEHASRSNPGGTSSAAGQVGHVLYWLRLGQRWLKGEDVEGDQNDSFTTTHVNGAQWQALQAELQAEVESFQQAVVAIQDWDSRKLNTVLNQLTHLAYHAGSIIQILKATA
ncbi:DinB family protein [Deinococcus humi]|uniref:DinB-like domain-containing protein n=1 Tax=Deinococcus humi TaxID=662880 RepID=A0A7W8K0U5_9DEIO|nr:DinB family protein [Deinococcus humi]MBB5365396.1 hypothetical protein [Deinococcus humi]GGO36044.1 hypothetical protein GCM10008949_39410 [Deinococcus humi]